MNKRQISNDEEINLKELLQELWHGKVYILFFSFLFMFFASMHLQDAQRKYLVQYKLKPVGEAQQSSFASGLGGFASLAGIQLPTNSTNDFDIFKQLISSVEVSEIIFKDKKLIKKIYEAEWNETLNSFSEPSKSKFRAYIGDLKRILTGDNKVNYMPPNARRLSAYISGSVSISDDKDSGFLNIRAETSKPKLLLSLISAAIEASDQIMRQRYVNFSKEPLAFYKEKIRIARSREHREALAELISKEEQKLMFASKGKYFIAEPYIDPTISLHPIAPKPMLILLLSLIFGSFTGCGIVLLRSKIMRFKK